jgi:hypothetical protein
MVMCACHIAVNLSQTFKGTLTIPLVSVSFLSVGGLILTKMDNKLGNFEEINEEKFNELIAKKEPRAFKVGETLNIRGSHFEVLEMKGNIMTLNLLGELMEDTIESLSQQLEDLKNKIEDDEDKCCPS